MAAHCVTFEPNEKVQRRFHTHHCKEEWLGLLAVLSGNKRAYRLESVTAFNMDDTAQIEKRRVGRFSGVHMNTMCMYQTLWFKEK